MTAILGLNAFHGDAAAALVVDGELVAAAEEERFNRVKHCAGFPTLAAAWCLADAGLKPEQLDHVAVSRDPKANLGQKLLRTIRHGASARYLKARLENAARVRDVRTALAQGLGIEPDALTARFHNVEHHQAHVASAFFVSPFEDAAILSIDGFGDFASTMLAEGHGNHFNVLERVLYPHSLGIFYTAVTQWLGFPHYGDEGKVMGLAPYGEPRYLNKMRELVKLDGPMFELDLDYFLHDKEGVDMTWDEGSPTIGRIYSDRMIETFGATRAPDAELTSHHNDVAASLQTMLEEAYLHVLQTLWERTHLPNLCLAGGVALNAVVNGRILPETPFEQLYVQPAAGDSGTAVGAAYYVWNQELGGPRGFVMEHAYTGPGYDDAEIEAAIAAAGLPERAARRRAALPRGRRADRRRRRRRLVPGADGVRPARARQPLDRDRPAPLRHEGHPQRADQAPRAVPAVRARRSSQSALGEWYDQDYPSPFMVLVYNTLRGQAGAGPRGRPRRRHRPRADGRGGGQPALLPAHLGVREADRRADRAQHLVQRERADRDDAVRGARHLCQHEDGSPRARQPRRSP